MYAKAKGLRSIEHATTLTYEKRAEHWDLEELTVYDFRKDQRAKIEADAAKSDYRDYARPVQQAYSNVVANTLSLLRGWSMDEKAKNIREKTKKKEKKALIEGQFQVLKREEDYEDDF